MTAKGTEIEIGNARGKETEIARETETEIGPGNATEGIGIETREIIELPREKMAGIPATRVTHLDINLDLRL